MKIKINRKKFLCVILASGCAVLLVNKYYLSGSLAGLACVLFMCLCCVNKLVRRKINIQLAPFSPRSEIRNLDALIIGGMINPEIINLDGKTFLQLSAPDRNIKSCYEILRHTHSILKDGGSVIIAVKNKNKCANESDFSIYDSQFFHRVTLEKYGLAKTFELADLLRHPLRACIFALGITSRKYNESECKSDEIKIFSDFCRERNYELRYFVS